MNRSDAGKKGYQKTGHIIRERLEERSRKTRQEYESNPNICPTCNTVVPYEKRINKFCSQSCAATFNNKGVVRVKTSNAANCANCDAKKEKRHNKYCDACIAVGVYTRKVTSLEEAGSDRSRKRVILEIRGHQCEKCGLSEWLNKPIPLDLDHVDGNPDNNVESNLRLLCPNCHALTETYKGANTGVDSSRHKMRRKRYSEGKTF